MNLIELAESHFLQTQSDRRLLHRSPELAFEEYKTAEFVISRLKSLGFDIKSEIAGTGLVASFDTGKSGPSFLFRFDMDALLLQEENDVDYCSQIPGKMHACGHDGHVSIGLTIAQIIHQIQDQLHGSFHLLFQPAEEIGQGAIKMLNEGVLDEIKPDFLLGVHLWNEKPFGWLGITDGPLMAASGTVEIHVNGKGGHGGQPQTSIDPIVASAQIVNQIQTIVSRNLNPFDSAVISICSIHGGTSFNITPSKVVMTGTIRYFTEGIHETITRRLEEICENTAKAMGCKVELNLEDLVNATCNDPVVAETTRKAVSNLSGQYQVDSTYQTMLSEDVGAFLERVPGCFVLVGAGEQQEGSLYPHHHPRFNFDERAMALAEALLLQTCMDLAR
jgi:amidohydrolase